MLALFTLSNASQAPIRPTLMTNSIVFLPGYAPNISQRRKELIKSTALSHAGSAAHRRRRKERKENAPPDAHDSRPPRGPTDASPIQGSPRTLLRAWCGNSDPFDVAGVLALSPRVAEILVFVRTHYLPAPFAAPPHSGALLTPWVEDHVKAGFKGILTSLQEPSCAQAYVYSASVGMSRMANADPSLATERIKMKGRALTALRHQFLESGQDQARILRSSEYLFSAAVMDRDATEAKMHGTIVRDLLHTLATRDGFSSINSSFLVRVMFKDAMLSEFSNTPTIFDPQVWEPILNASLAPTEPMLPDLVPSFDEPLDEFVDHGDLHTVFIDSRRALWAYRRPWIVYSGYAGQYWAYSRLVVLQCRAVNHYVQLSQHIVTQPTTPTRVSHDEVVEDLSRRVEVCLALAALLFASLFRCRLEQLFYHNTNQLLHQLHLESTATLDLLHSATQSVPAPVLPLLNALHGPLLWTLFLGATTELQSKSSTSSSPYPPPNCTPLLHAFHAHITHMDLSSWPAVTTVLSRFVYAPSLLHPHAKQRARLQGRFAEDDVAKGDFPDEDGFRYGSNEKVQFSLPDETLERPWMCHEANFTAYLNRSESLRASVMRSSTDRR